MTVYRIDKIARLLHPHNEKKFKCKNDIGLSLLGIITHTADVVE